MAITILKDGDLFDCGANILVNATNCEGIMGGGIALAFKERFPDMFKDYVEVCKRGCVPGILHTYLEGYHTTIINFPTKNLVANPSEMKYIKQSAASFINTLVALRIIYSEKPNKRALVAIPALGCGLGGLEWENVKPLLIRMCEHPLLSDYDFVIFEPK